MRGPRRPRPLGRGARPRGVRLGTLFLGSTAHRTACRGLDDQGRMQGSHARWTAGPLPAITMIIGAVVGDVS